MPPIFVVTGPPAAGKSSLCRALMQRYEKGFHIPVDDLREWVVSGIAHPIGWTVETRRQFALAEEAAADLAIRYNDAGFAVALDHCSGPPDLNKLIETRFSGRQVFKVAVITDLETNQRRNRERTDKNFDTAVLKKAIDRLNPLFHTSDLESDGWLMIDNSPEGIDSAVEALYNSAHA